MNRREFKKYRTQLNNATENYKIHSTDLKANMNEFIEKNRLTLERINNIETEIEDIDKQFSEKTGILNPKDQKFLWTAVALQTLRWYLQPSLKFDLTGPDIENRKTAAEGGRQEERDNRAYLDKNSDKGTTDDGFIPWTDYFVRPVPYDAMRGSENIIITGVTEQGKNIYGKNHHAATLGHDPVLGYFFGSLNIMTSTITFSDGRYSTNIVNLTGAKSQEIGSPTLFGNILLDALKAEQSDTIRIPAAVARQKIHMESDRYTKMGLPLPLLSAELKQKFLEAGWNSEELRRISENIGKNFGHNLGITSIQFLLALVINMVIKTMHILMFEEDKDIDFQLYSVRTAKILSVSSIIAESLNIAYVGSHVAIGIKTVNTGMIKQGLTKIDIGGYIEAIHRIVSSASLQEKMRREYLQNKLYERLVPNFSFMED